MTTTVKCAGLGLALAAVASCGQNKTAIDPASGTARNTGASAPPVMVDHIEGLPPEQAAQLQAELSAAAGQRDVGIRGGAPQGGSYSLSGRFVAAPQNAGVRVAYQWQLRDAGGVVVQTINGGEDAGLFAGLNAWDAVAPPVIERIAHATADSVATRMSQLGYGTRVVTLDRPPPDYFVKAGKGAEREVDLALLNGGALPQDATLDGLGPEADVTAVSSTPPATNYGSELPLAEDVPPQAVAAAPAEAAAVADDVIIAAAPEAQPIPAAQTSEPEIRAVAVLPVRGAGSGDAELTEAMRRILKSAGWPVVSEPQPDAIIVSGLVRVSDPEAGQQNVSVRWDVKMPGGSQLGDVKQSNSVPAGTFDAGWGQSAVMVAEAAASGIFDIVKRFQ